MNMIKSKGFKKALTFLTIMAMLITLIPALAFAADRGEWAPNVYYSAGDTVTYQGNTYTAIQPHTSLVGWEPPNVPALWQPGGNGGGGGGDNQPPTAPTNLTVTGTTSNSVSLSWNASTDNVGVTGYDVYRNSTLAVSVTGTNATVSGLSPNMTYTFTVRAKDAAGNVSAPSNAVNATTQAGGGGGGTCSEPAWDANAIYIGGNRVSYNGKIYEAKWWTQGDRPDQSGEWGVWRYIQDCGSGGVDNEPPTAPTNLTVTGTTSNSVSLSWNASTDNVGVTGYDVYRNSTLAVSVTGTSATVSGLSPNTTYTFTVRAKDAAGNVSAPSNAVNATTQAGGGGGGDKKVVGYFPSWSGSVNNIQFDKLTHVMYAFLLPNPDGSLKPIENPGKLQSLVSAAHANNVKVLIAVGGWNNGDDSAFETLASTSAGRTNFVNNLVNFVNQYNLDGVDMDWEYPDPGASADNYALLMQQLSNELHSRGKLLTAAVVALGYYGGGIKNEVFDYVDFLNLMAYDGGNGPTHSPYSYAVDSLNYWLGRGLPKEKAVLGVPYYARPSWSTYSTKVAQNPMNACRDTDGSDYWNGIPTIRQKAQLARNQAGGIMTWELSQDTNGPNSLLTAMYEAINGLPGSYNCN